MLHVQRLAVEYFSRLEEIDKAIAATVAAAGCPHCDGPLHRGDYRRKPRGGLVAAAGEAFTRRHSLCCGRRGCRKRSLPPSLRFLGRRIYLETVVLLAGVWEQVLATLRDAVDRSGVPARTLRRWGSWWRGRFPTLPIWTELQACFVPPPPDPATLPQSLITRIEEVIGAGGDVAPKSRIEDVMLLVARCLAPMTTRSVVDGSRFVRAVFAATAAEATG